MTLPAPNLDDRKFQDLVDDAKRLVQQRCPEWTDHNVSDPGVTLIETVAYMVDQLIYRLNRVPERNYIKFLELIGVRLYPPTAARTDVTFWLSAPQPNVVSIAPGTRVATVRTEQEESVTFEVTEELSIVHTELAHIVSTIDGKSYRNHSEAIGLKESFLCFDMPPKPDDALLIGLNDAAPSCAILLRLDCTIEGVGVDPRNPPLEWEAWTGERWERCELDRDETGGLNRAGDVVIHLPRGHQVSVINRLRAGWIRCRITKAEEGQPTYSASPKIIDLEVSTIGGTAHVINAELVQDEVLGVSEGVPGQRFETKHQPVVRDGQPTIVQISNGDGWHDWREIEDFAESGPDDKHFALDAVSGRVVFGPAVREHDGTLRQFGAVPPKGATVRVKHYRTGGGHRGNVARAAISVPKSTIPYVSGVTNRHRATGGVDAEELENAKIRGPILMRTRNRAVTKEDFEQLGREAAPEAARIRCVSADNGADAGSVRVLVVPNADENEIGQLRFEQLVPEDETLKQIKEFLDQRRVIGARVIVEPPTYQGVTVVARMRAKPRVSPQRVEKAALEALYHYFHPITGGPEGTGWPFGRPVQAGEVYSVLLAIPGAEFVDEARLFAADPVTGQRGKAVQRIDLDPHALIFSYEHQVMVETDEVEE
jgi:predicted phage baseplate assembly protein